MWRISISGRIWKFNFVNRDNKVFECEDNHLIVLWRNARRDLGHGTKLSLARDLVRLIADSYAASLAGAGQRDSAQA